MAKTGTDKAPVVLQVLPALGTGGVERGTVEMAQAIAAAGWRALVASAGGARAQVTTRSQGDLIEALGAGLPIIATALLALGFAKVKP